MKYSFALIAAATLTAATFSGCGGGSGSGAPAATGPTGTIAFATARDGNPEIYTIDDNSANLRRLTNSPASDIYPSISRTGNKIAWLSVAQNLRHVNVMNADGTGKVELTSNILDNQPAISPDGSRIAFLSGRAGGSQLFIVPSAGGNPVQLTSDTTQKAFPPAFSPDGQTLVFTGFTSDNNGNVATDGVYRVSVNGGTPQLIVNAPPTPGDASLAGAVAFTPDGKVLFNTRTISLLIKLYQVNLDGSNLQDITHGPTTGILVTVSPDGTRLAYDRINPGQATDLDSDIVIRPFAGGTEKLLVSHAGLPSWGPKVP